MGDLLGSPRVASLFSYVRVFYVGDLLESPRVASLFSYVRVFYVVVSFELRVNSRRTWQLNNIFVFSKCYLVRDKLFNDVVLSPRQTL